MNLYLIYYIMYRVDKRGDALRTSHAHVVLCAIASTNYCYYLLHIVMNSISLFFFNH